MKLPAPSLKRALPSRKGPVPAVRVRQQVLAKPVVDGRSFFVFVSLVYRYVLRILELAEQTNSLLWEGGVALGSNAGSMQDTTEYSTER